MATILLVEDTVDLARTIAGELQLSGYEVIMAENGPDALTLHDGTRPDLVILDTSRWKARHASARGLRFDYRACSQTIASSGSGRLCYFRS